MDVLRDSPAAQAGLVTGDVITKFNDKPIKDDSDLILKMSMTQPGAQVSLTVIRAGNSERKVTIQVAETPGTRVLRKQR
jgi:serine protease Do